MRRIQNKQPIYSGWSLRWLGTQMRKLWSNEKNKQQQKSSTQMITNLKQTENKKLEISQKKQYYELEDEKTKVLNRMRSKKFKNKQHFQDKIKRVYRYFNRKQNLINKQNQIEFEDVAVQKFKSADLECAICLYYFVKPVTTICGHSFCIRCLDQTLLIKAQCPSCRNYLRGTKLVQCESLQKLSLRQIQKYSNEQIQYYNQTLKQTLQWLDKRKIDFQRLRISDQIDVKDTQYIWCKAQVKQIYVKYDQVDSVLVHYIGWNSIYDQIIDVNSDRLANCGFYTDRNNIPHYRIDQYGQRMYSYVVTNERQFNIMMNQNQNDIMPNPNPLNLQMLNNNFLSDMNMIQQNFQIRSLQVIFEQSIQSQDLGLSVRSQNNSQIENQNFMDDINLQQNYDDVHGQDIFQIRNNGDSFSDSSFGGGSHHSNHDANNFQKEQQKMNFSFGQQEKLNFSFGQTKSNNENIINLIQNFEQQIQEHHINLFNTNFFNSDIIQKMTEQSKYFKQQYQDKFEKEQEQKEKQIKNPEEKISIITNDQQMQTGSDTKEVQFIKFGWKKSKEQQDISLI